MGTPAPTAAPTPAPTAAPTPAPTAAPTPAPVAVAAVHVVPVIHAIPVQYVQVVFVPVQHQSVQFYSGNIGHCQYAAVGVSRSGEQEVVGIDGARYTLKKIE